MVGKAQTNGSVGGNAVLTMGSSLQILTTTGADPGYKRGGVTLWPHPLLVDHCIVQIQR